MFIGQLYIFRAFITGFLYKRNSLKLILYFESNHFVQTTCATMTPSTNRYSE